MQDNKVSQDLAQSNLQIAQPLSNQNTLAQGVQVEQFPNLDLGELKLDGVSDDDKSIVLGDSTLTVSQFPVERMKFTKERPYLVSIPTKQVIGLKYHYEEKIGYYKCFGGSCCNTKPPSVRYVRPCIIYDTSNKLEVVSRNLKFASLVLGQDNNDFLNDIFAGLDITEWDIIIKCTDEKYQKLQIRRSNNKAIYRGYPDMVQEVSEFWKQNYKHILKPLFHVYTEQELEQKRKEVMGVAPSEETQNISEEEMNSVFKDS